MPRRTNRNETAFTQAAIQHDLRQRRDESPIPSAPAPSERAPRGLRIPGNRASHKSPRARFLALVRDHDILHVFDAVTDDALVDFGQGMAYEAIRGEYTAASGLARNIWRIPDDAIELVTSAALTAFYPHAGQIVLARPSDATVRELSRVLAEHGLRLSRRD